MTLALVCENEFGEVKAEDIQLEVFKKIIKKDLEVTYRCNQINSIFDDFAIHSDFNDELSSFALFISILTQKNISEIEGTVLANASEQCSDFFFEQVISLDRKYNSAQLEELAGHFADYIYQVSKDGEGSGGVRLEILDIHNRYFHYQTGIITSSYTDKKMSI